LFQQWLAVHMSRVLELVRGFVEGALALVYPEVCQLCGAQRASADECFVCADCRASVRYILPPFCQKCGLPFQGAITNAFECANCQGADWAFSSARSAVVARDAMLDIIHRYKYRHALWFEPFLAELLIERALPVLRSAKWDWVVPVPLHPTKQREREFNQAERLARRLSVAAEFQLNTPLLLPRLQKRTQTLLSREERLANVRKAFVTRKGVCLKGERVVLIDDVFTTGATTGACASVLRSCGAGEVCVWTVARGI
jgi:competence protein ComFC